MHRDIKPDNVMLLADLELSRRLGPELSGASSGFIGAIGGFIGLHRA
jgi:hypothetical protein